MGARVLRPGEQAQVGQLVFTVLDSEWKQMIEDVATPKYPTQRFLVVQMTVTNSGATETTIPHLTLQDAKGKTYPEFGEAGGVPEWLGVLRRIRPVETQQGRIVFDVPVGAYQLRVTDSFEEGAEKYALIEIPLRIEPDNQTAPLTPMPEAPGK
ncbi:MAG: DUF4352 domain-containing protein [Acidobacteriales bacterium]|nr:DUF4352 domain-containing protein [Terriglobales bacterium]